MSKHGNDYENLLKCALSYTVKIIVENFNILSIMLDSKIIILIYNYYYN